MMNQRQFMKKLKKTELQIRYLNTEIDIVSHELIRRKEEKRQLLRDMGCFVLNSAQEKRLRVDEKRGLYNVFYNGTWAQGLSRYNAICNLIMKLPVDVLEEFLNIK
jgi:hypothetical protein